MPRYKNAGAPWRRGPGVIVPPGGIFEATEREHERIMRRTHLRRRFERLEDEAPAPAAPAPSAETTTTAPPKSNTAVKWPLRMAPAMYLKLHPTGKHAKTARMLVGEE